MNNLISCADCQKNMSTDADACPSCGRVNDWVHPALVDVIAFLEKQEFETEYEVRGHEMALSTQFRNYRQKTGMFILAVSILLLLGGLIESAFLGLAIGLQIIGGCLIGFGLSASTSQELRIDLRKPSKVIGQYDHQFWQDVVDIINEKNADDISNPSPLNTTNSNSNKKINLNDEMGVVEYWFSTPLQGLITVIGFASMIWIGFHFFPTDRKELLSCAGEMMQSSSGGVSPKSYSEYKQLYEEIEDADSVEVLNKKVQKFGSTVMTTYSINLDNRKTQFIAGDC